jgi:ATP-binding cassette, subfamily B, multidrug efflux pump
MRDFSGLEAYLDVEEQSARRVETRTLRPLIAKIQRHRLSLLGGFVLMVASTAATLLEPVLFGRAIDEAIVPGNWPLLERFTIIFFGVVCVRIVATIGQGYLFELLGQRVTHDLRNELFSHLLRLPVAVYDKTPAGRLLTRVTNDIASLGEMFSAGFVSILSNFLLVVGILVYLIHLDTRIGLIAASVFPGLLILAVYFSGRLRIAYREARSKLSALNAFLAENLLGMKVVQLFSREALHLERFDRINEWYAEAQVGTIRIFALFQPSITLFAGLSAALVISYGGHAVRGGSLKVGVLVIFFSLVLALFQPVRELADKWNVFLSGMASAERIFSVLSWPTEVGGGAVPLPTHVKPLSGVSGRIVFENVWFAYEGEHWVLRDFSVEIPAGGRVGVVGHTGAGKTTLISLLMRFYEPQRGRILLDGKDLRELDKRALRAAIGIIQQDVFLFSGSLIENLTFWGEGNVAGEAPLQVPEKVRAALVAIGFADWFEGPEKKALQERGSNFSMGERQVLAFGRALAVDPAIWILDEATANMDSRTEDRMQTALFEASRGRTSLLIAHRLATVRTADLILVLHKGTLVESGDHNALMARNGLYARLYRFQEASSLVSEATPQSV